MEADWEVELGGGAPVIEPQWPGYIDLRKQPKRIAELEEVGRFPALASALLRLNQKKSPLWTAKCDFWPRLEEGEWDAIELNAPDGEDLCAAGCYIDLLPAKAPWENDIAAETLCRRWCIALEKHPLPGARADLIARQVWLNEAFAGLGATAYLTACGKSEALAHDRLATALEILTDVLTDHSTVK